MEHVRSFSDSGHIWKTLKGPGVVKSRVNEGVTESLCYPRRMNFIDYDFLTFYNNNVMDEVNFKFRMVTKAKVGQALSMIV